MSAPLRPLADLKANECRWPVNDADHGEAHLFCGAPAATGKPYCPDHYQRAYQSKGQTED